PRCRSIRAAKSPLIEPPMTSARLCGMPRPASVAWAICQSPEAFCILPKVVAEVPARKRSATSRFLEKTMALTTLEKMSDQGDRSGPPIATVAEFERERVDNNPCVGTELLSENERARVWIIRLKPGERVGFHRHVLDYFWTCVTGGRGRQHVHDGKTVEYSYAPGETRHESYAAGEFKVHDLENTGDKDMVF